jgi:hypothetical protein
MKQRKWVGREKCERASYDNLCHELRYHARKSRRNLRGLPMQRGGVKLVKVCGMDRKGLYAASSGGLSGFSEMNLASTSPQSAHWKYWIAISCRARWSSIARTFTGSWHFGQGVSMNNVKDMVNPFRARRTEDTQKGPIRYYEGPGRFDVAPHQINSAPLQIYVKNLVRSLQYRPIIGEAPPPDGHRVSGAAPSCLLQSAIIDRAWRNYLTTRESCDSAQDRRA